MSVKNRGKYAENLIKQANKHYQLSGQAMIFRQHAEVKTIRSKKNWREIENTFYSDRAGLDFAGVVDGRYISFDSKQTKGKSLPMESIHKHQIASMQNIIKCGGDAFVFILFSDLDEGYLYPASHVVERQDMIAKGEKVQKSIPLDDCRKRGYRIKEQNNVLADWLSAYREYKEQIDAS